eukprot:gene13634-biopygen7826
MSRQTEAGASIDRVGGMQLPRPALPVQYPTAGCGPAHSVSPGLFDVSSLGAKGISLDARGASVRANIHAHVGAARAQARVRDIAHGRRVAVSRMRADSCARAPAPSVGGCVRRRPPRVEGRARERGKGRKTVKGPDDDEAAAGLRSRGGGPRTDPGRGDPGATRRDEPPPAAPLPSRRPPAPAAGGLSADRGACRAVTDAVFYSFLHADLPACRGAGGGLPDPLPAKLPPAPLLLQKGASTKDGTLGPWDMCP